MERTAWTDERLDDLSKRMDAGFDRVDADIRELRVEVRNQGGELREEIRTLSGDLRGEMVSKGSGLRGEIEALRVSMLRFGGGMIIGFVGVIAAVLAHG